MPDGRATEIWRRNLAPMSGASREGLPLSENRGASADLDPWIARLVSAKATNSADIIIACGMCNDLNYTRHIFNGRWTAMTAEGHGTFQNEVLQFGQHSRFMPLTCTGDIMSAGFGLRAGAFYALTGRSADEVVDRIEQEDTFGLLADDLRDVYSDNHAPGDWNLAMEEAMRRYIARVDPPPPDPISAAFELADRICDEDVEINRRIGEHGLGVIRDLFAKRGDGGEPFHILTHCNAGWLATVDWGTAIAPIYKAHEAGIPVHVWVDETRPRNQGAALTCWELAQADIPHSLIVDNAGGHLMQAGQVDHDNP